jgi:hypothetical protein
MANISLIPALNINYNGKSTGRDLTDSLISFDYQDNISDRSDTVSITFEDISGFWRDNLPDTGATLDISFGYEGSLVDINNSFEIDRISYTGSPSVVTLSGNAAPNQKQLRTRISQSWDNQSLQTIIKTVAQRTGLATDLRFKDIPLDYTAQNNETDLNFLIRLCDEADLNLKLNNNTITCVPMSDLMAQKPFYTIPEDVLISWDVDIDLVETVKKVERRKHDTTTKELIVYAVDEKGSVIQTGTTKAAQTTKNVKREIARQTHAAATNADLARANRDRKRISFRCFGIPVIAAGRVITLVGMGKNARSCLVQTVNHTIDKSSGYITSVEGWLL